MRRVLVLFLLTLTALQLAFAGLPVAAAAVQAGSHMLAPEDAAARTADHCIAHSSAAETAAESPCNSPQVCSLCGVCQMCHQAALAHVQAEAVPMPSARWVFPRDNARYLSAERAPSFKPPIL